MIYDRRRITEAVKRIDNVARLRALQPGNDLRQSVEVTIPQEPSGKFLSCNGFNGTILLATDARGFLLLALNLGVGTAEGAANRTLTQAGFIRDATGDSLYLRRWLLIPNFRWVILLHLIFSLGLRCLYGLKQFRISPDLPVTFVLGEV